MSHGHPAHARDRTLVLRILVPSLRTALGDKMAALEDRVSSDASSARRAQQQRQAAAQQSLSGTAAAMALAASAASAAASDAATSASGGKSSAQPGQSRVLDLDGVSCAPLGDGSTLWSFRCDGMTYPARLTNLPCPVEVHRTSDRATYNKAADVGQILIVYEDMTHLEEAEGVPNYRTEGYPSYYHSGLTPPMKRVVERRFAAREHRSVAPSKSEVAEVEKELKTLIGRVTTKVTGKGKKAAGPAMGHGGQGKAIEEIVEDVVEYEPWMDDNGRQPNGVKFDEKDVMATKHPEVWLDPEDVRDEKAERRKKDDAAAMAATAATAASAGTAAGGGGTKVKSSKKKDSKKDGTTDGVTTTTKKKKKKKKDPAAAAAAAAAEAEESERRSPTPPGQPHVKKGIPSLKSREAAAAQAAAAAAAAAANAPEVDEVTQVATQIANMENNDEADLMALDDFFDFDGDDLDMDLAM